MPLVCMFFDTRDGQESTWGRVYPGYVREGDMWVGKGGSWTVVLVVLLTAFQFILRFCQGNKLAGKNVFIELIFNLVYNSKSK